MAIRLSDIRTGGEAAVVGLNAEGMLGRRLLDLGLVPGTNVHVLRASPLGDPRAYLIRGAVIALREKDAGQVMVEGS